MLLPVCLISSYCIAIESTTPTHRATSNGHDEVSALAHIETLMLLQGKITINLNCTIDLQ